MSAESFIFSEQLSEINASTIPEPTRDLEQELFGKKGIKEVIDVFEQEMGLGKPRETKQNLKYYNRIFCPSADEDQELLNELLNDKDRYRIIMWDKTWTVHGDYRVFVVYSENLDVKKKDEPSEEEEENE